MATATGKVTVSREGVITRDGENLGYVMKEIRQGLFLTAMGAGYSGGGTPYWVPFADDGTKLSDGFDTRKRAVQRVVDNAEPLTVTDLKTEYGIGSYRTCVTAGVRYKGFYLGVSRYAEESDWIIDYLSTPDSLMPVFSNGTGSRVTRGRRPQPAVSEALTNAAIAAGLWPITE